MESDNNVPRLETPSLNSKRKFFENAVYRALSSGKLISYQGNDFLMAIFDDDIDNGNYQNAVLVKSGVTPTEAFQFTPDITRNVYLLVELRIPRKIPRGDLGIAFEGGKIHLDFYRLYSDGRMVKEKGEVSVTDRRVNVIQPECEISKDELEQILDR